MTFAVTAPVDDLTPDRARQMLGRVAVAAYFAGRDTTYVRIRFEGNGRAVAFWDVDAGRGVVMIGNDDQEVDSIDQPWPSWLIRLDELNRELVNQSAVVA